MIRVKNIILIITVLSIAIQLRAGTVDEKPSGNIVDRIVAYFDDANEEKTDGRFDFSVIGGPHYSSDTKLGLGLVAAGIYRTDRTDSLLTMSNVSLYGDIATSGFYMIGIRGINVFPKERYRLDYDVNFQSFPTKYWGIGYENGSRDDNETEYDDFRVQAEVDFMVRIAQKLYVGPMARFDYIKASDVERQQMWLDERLETTTIAVGLSLLYDTRDNLTNAYSGVYLRLDQRFSPKFIGNKAGFSSTEISASCYGRAWRGAVIAGNFHALLNYGTVPWGMMATLGGSHTMRGYYEGRYRDKMEMDATVELRQHVWGRSGVVVWIGAGTVFPKFSQLRHLLPNYGVGYRWEFKKRVNVRLDMGFGRGENGFIFSINEAF